MRGIILGFLLFYYFLSGFVVISCPISFFQNEHNSIKKIGFMLIWPVAQSIPKKVTVEMLAAYNESKYQPGQWIN